MGLSRAPYMSLSLKTQSFERTTRDRISGNKERLARRGTPQRAEIIGWTIRLSTACLENEGLAFIGLDRGSTSVVVRFTPGANRVTGCARGPSAAEKTKQNTSPGLSIAPSWPQHRRQGADGGVRPKGRDENNVPARAEYGKQQLLHQENTAADIDAKEAYRNPRPSFPRGRSFRRVSRNWRTRMSRRYPMMLRAAWQDCRAVRGGEVIDTAYARPRPFAYLCDESVGGRRAADVMTREHGRRRGSEREESALARPIATRSAG